MTFKSSIAAAYHGCESIPVVGSILFRLRYPLKRCVYFLNRSSRDASWSARISDAIACPDNAYIPRVPEAGLCRNGRQIMHNGLLVLAGSYHGEPMRRLLEANRGVHEPQEERVFQEVLSHLPPSALMVELGAYWGFYSMWFHQRVEEPTCILVEPNAGNLRYGKANFAANNMEGRFYQGMVGATCDSCATIPVVTIDTLVDELGIERIHILHSDIQGAEYEMLLGSQQTLRGIIDYVFISTHSNELHDKCRQYLEDCEFDIIADANLDESFSVDGLIVGRGRRTLDGLGAVDISKKSTIWRELRE